MAAVARPSSASRRKRVFVVCICVCSYLSHLIGHEGDGSILAFLKDQDWANSLSAGVSRSFVDSAFFAVHVDLTEAGLAQLNDVVATVYRYIAMLRKEGPQSYLFEEMRVSVRMSMPISSSLFYSMLIRSCRMWRKHNSNSSPRTHLRPTRRHCPAQCNSTRMSMCFLEGCYTSNTRPMKL
jgi:hypothetical protein